MDILAAPLLDYQLIPSTRVGEEDTSRYVYGPGEIRLTTEWDLPGGGIGHGWFVGRLPGLVFEVTEIEFRGDIFFGGYIPLGPGLFDPALAEYLGVAPRSLGGLFHLVADVYGPIGGERYAAYSGARLTIDAVDAVPEPATWLLLGLGGLAGLVRGRRDWRSQT